jgi:hypothetical protein
LRRICDGLVTASAPELRECEVEVCHAFERIATYEQVTYTVSQAGTYNALPPAKRRETLASYSRSLAKKTCISYKSAASKYARLLCCLHPETYSKKSIYHSRRKLTQLTIVIKTNNS